jgi:predicted RNA-binding Zn ribbon-like protein
MTIAPATRPAPFFVGDHPALDFLNTTAAPWGERIEWLSNGADLLAWLEQAGAIDAAVAAQFSPEGDAASTLDAVAEQARNLREWLRKFVKRHAGSELGPNAIKELRPLNRLLACGEPYRQIEAAGKDGPNTGGKSAALRWRQEHRWTSPDRLLQPIAETIGDLVCEADFRLIRACEGTDCVIIFYDRTKGHARRWCSMAVCGNRAKAAVHRAKRRRQRIRN